MSNWRIVDDGIMDGTDGEGSIEMAPRTHRTNSLPQTPYWENAPHPPCRHPLPLGGGEGLGRFIGGERAIPEDSPELNVILKRCLKRIHRWPVPFHWSYADWREEVAAQGQSAAWQALEDYDASRGVPFSAFVHVRVMTSVLTRYRQEWAYGSRRLAIDEDWEIKDSAEETFGSGADHAALHRALALLPPSDRQLLVELFWEDRTESDIARSRDISQPAVHKRKRRVLGNLHEQLDGAEKFCGGGY